MMHGAPAPGHKREAALVQVSCRTPQCVAGAGINVRPFGKTDFLTGSANRLTCTFVAGID
jgi:hypothetical protein